MWSGGGNATASIATRVRSGNEGVWWAMLAAGIERVGVRMKVERRVEKLEARAEEAAAGGARIFRRDRYLQVFVLILLTVLSSAFISDGSWGLIITLLLQTATLLVALRTSDAGPKSQLVAGVVATLTIVSITLALVTKNDRLAHAAYGASMVALVAVTPIAIVRRLISHPTVNIMTITGAANIYLLFGLFWASIYSFIGAVARVGSQTPAVAFFISSNGRTPIGSDFIYYSYVTLTTVGYGDLTSASQIGRMVSITESLVGQLYLVIVVSVLVANVGRVREHKLLPENGSAEPATNTPAASE